MTVNSMTNMITMTKGKLPHGQRKYIRDEKARIRNLNLSKEEIAKKINELYAKQGMNYPKTDEKS
jgi:hypothetical protein